MRILLDEDVPYDLAAALTDRGFHAVHVNDLEPEVRTDAQLCAEAARQPTVLVTCNVRDYADRAFQEANVVRYRIAVALIRVSKAESRPAAVRDIVHRWAHRLAALPADAPVVASLSRAGFRVRTM